MFTTIAIGYLVADPRFAEIVKDGEKRPVSNFRIAIDDRITGKTDYVDCAAWNGLTKACKYLYKGRPVAVIGKVSASHNFSQKTGKIYDNINLHVNTLELLGSGKRFTENGAVETAEVQENPPQPVVAPAAAPEPSPFDYYDMEEGEMPF